MPFLLLVGAKQAMTKVTNSYNTIQVKKLHFTQVDFHYIGSIQPDSKIGPELNKLNVSIVPNEYCQLTYGNLIKETNICADSVEGQGT